MSLNSYEWVIIMINRQYYLNQIISKMWDGNIKVITGIKRCGKSTRLSRKFVF